MFSDIKNLITPLAIGVGVGVSALAGRAMRSSSLGLKAAPAVERKLSLADLPAPALLSVSACLEYTELLTLEKILAFDQPLVRECWKEALQTHIAAQPRASEASTAGTQKSKAALGQAKTLLRLLSRLEKFQAKRFVLSGIAAQLELKPPFHFFEKSVHPDIPGCRFVSFNSVVAAGTPGRVEWMSLSFLVTAGNVEIFVCTGHDTQTDNRTLVIAAPFDARIGICENLLGIVEALKNKQTELLVEVFADARSMVSEISMREFKKFDKRCGVSLVKALAATRVIVDPPLGAGTDTHAAVLQEVERKSKHLSSRK